MASQTFDSILVVGDVSPRKATTFPWDKVKPYVQIDKFSEEIMKPLNSYRQHPVTIEFVQTVSTNSKEASNA